MKGYERNNEPATPRAGEGDVVYIRRGDTHDAMADKSEDVQVEPKISADNPSDHVMDQDDTQHFFEEVNADDDMSNDQDHERTAMMDVLQTLGVDAEVA